MFPIKKEDIKIMPMSKPDKNYMPFNFTIVTAVYKKEPELKNGTIIINSFQDGKK